jgi:hypothetical protein
MWAPWICVSYTHGHKMLYGTSKVTMDFVFCGSFNNAVSNWNYISSEVWMIINWKGCGQKHSWSNSWYPSQDSNQAPLETWGIATWANLAWLSNCGEWGQWHSIIFFIIYSVWSIPSPASVTIEVLSLLKWFHTGV